MTEKWSIHRTVKTASLLYSMGIYCMQLSFINTYLMREIKSQEVGFKMWQTR